MSDTSSDMPVALNRHVLLEGNTWRSPMNDNHMGLIRLNSCNIVDGCNRRSCKAIAATQACQRNIPCCDIEAVALLTGKAGYAGVAMVGIGIVAMRLGEGR